MRTALTGRTHGCTDQPLLREDSPCQLGAVHTWHYCDLILCRLEFRFRRDSVAKLGCICQRSSSVSFCRALVPLSRRGSCGIDASAPTPDATPTAGKRRDRRWGTAEEVNEPPQVLRGCGEQHLVPRAAQASQSKPVEPEDALHVRKSHLDLLALAR